jgi:hypothetical protein
MRWGELVVACIDATLCLTREWTKWKNGTRWIQASFTSPRNPCSIDLVSLQRTERRNPVFKVTICFGRFTSSKWRSNFCSETNDIQLWQDSEEIVRMCSQKRSYQYSHNLPVTREKIPDYLSSKEIYMKKIRSHLVSYAENDFHSVKLEFCKLTS